MYNLHEWKDQN